MERPLYSVGINDALTIGSVVLANRQDIYKLALSTVDTAIVTATTAVLKDDTKTNDDDDDDWRNNWRIQNNKDEQSPTKKKVSKERLRARALGAKTKRWEKYKTTNAIEVEQFQRQLTIANDIEQQKRMLTAEKLKPINPYQEYFGHDSRKAYPYSKYTVHSDNVKSLLRLDKEIKQMQSDIQDNVEFRATHTLFEKKVSVQSLRKKKQQEQAQTQQKQREQGHTHQQHTQQPIKQQSGQQSFLTNNKSSKLLFAGSMDARTHEAEMNQAWNHYNEGLSIWDAVRLGDVPRCKELLDKSKKYREKVAKYTRKGWLPLPPFERDHLNARGVDGQTPLHLVVMMRDNKLHDQIFALLLKHDASVSAQTIEGYTPLHYCMASPLENMDMMTALLDKADAQKERERARDGTSDTVTQNEQYQERSLAQLSKMSDVLVGGGSGEGKKGVEAKEEQVAWKCQSCNHPNHGGKICAACNKVPSKWFLELEQLQRPIDMTTVYGETITSMAIKSGREDRLQLVLKVSGGGG